MKEEIKVPSLGESISEAIISAILKPAGALVHMDDELIELATDKVNQVLYAPQAGVFTPLVKQDDVVKIGQVIGIIEAGPAGPAAKTETPIKSEKSPEPPPVELKPEVPSKADDGSKARVGVDEYLEQLQAPPSPGVKNLPQETILKPKQGGPSEVRRKMTNIRKIIASRLVEVQKTTAMLTTFNEVDLTEIMQLREKYKDDFAKTHGARLGLMSFFVKAAVSALKAYPMVNSYIEGDEIVERLSYSIGIAVGSDKGLVVPVLKNCEQLSFGEIEGAIARYAQQVKEGKLSADDLSGGGFTITNGGVYGSLLSTPILSPKQCAILGMHKISKRPMVVDDQIVIRQMMYLALSYDHRIIDGKEAVSFLVHIKNCLEDPRRMLLES